MSVKEKSKPAPGNDLAKRLSALVGGRTIARVLRADAQELALQLDDGSRVFVRVVVDGLDISVT